MIKNFKIFEKQLSYNLSHFDWEYFNMNNTDNEEKFKIDEYVYANPKLNQNMNMINKRLQVTKVFPSGYVVVDRYPNFALSNDRLISELEYNSNKYNL